MSIEQVHVYATTTPTASPPSKQMHTAEQAENIHSNRVYVTDNCLRYVLSTIVLHMIEIASQTVTMHLPLHTGLHTHTHFLFASTLMQEVMQLLICSITICHASCSNEHGR